MSGSRGEVGFSHPFIKRRISALCSLAAINFGDLDGVVIE
jgi:hypothetical protein